jgi:hypothetical protein
VFGVNFCFKDNIFLFDSTLINNLIRFTTKSTPANMSEHDSFQGILNRFSYFKEIGLSMKHVIIFKQIKIRNKHFVAEM